MHETCMPCLQGNHRKCRTGPTCACSICRKVSSPRPVPAARTRGPQRKVNKPKERPLVEKEVPATELELPLRKSDQHSFFRAFRGPERRVAEIMIDLGAPDHEIMEKMRISREKVQALREEYGRSN